VRPVIVVGAGNWGQNLVRQFDRLQALAGVVEVDPTKQDALRHQYPDIPLYSRYEEALEKEAAIVIATHASSHYSLAKQALVAGKDLYIEKPMTLEVSQARELATYADEHSRVLMVGHLLLYQPAIRWMSDYIARGEIGQVHHVSTARLKLGKVRREENVWWSFAPHDISVVLDLLGNPTLQEVRANGQAIVQPEVIDNIHVDLVFSEGKTAHVHCSWLWPELQRSTIAIGEKQMLIYDEARKIVTVHDKGIDGDLQNRVGESWQPTLDTAEPLAIECQHFLDRLVDRQSPLSNGWNGVAVIEVLEKAQEVFDG
jgi:predicted dehydrogenase